MQDGNPVLIHLPEINFIDDKKGKPVAINQHIGRRPIAAFGNSGGDLQMLQWTTTRARPGRIELTAKPSRTLNSNAPIAGCRTLLAEKQHTGKLEGLRL